MENAQKKPTNQTRSVAGPLWDPFWFVRAMFGWGRSGDASSFDVNETDDTYFCKGKFKLALPDQADVAHVKAELDNGELTLVVPKAAAPTPEPVSPAQRAPRPTANRGGSAGRKARGGARTRARRR